MANKKKKDTTEDEELSANKLVIGDDDDEDEDEGEDLDEDEEDEEEEDEQEEDLEEEEEEYDEDEYDEDEDDEDDEADQDRDLAQAPVDAAAEDDPFWWTPHAVLATLLVAGLLGFFGFFNKWLSPVFAGSASQDGQASAASAAPTPEPPKTVTVDARQAKPPEAADAAQTYGAKHILVQYKGSMRANPKIERTKDEAKARADEVAKKVAASKSSASREEDWRKLVTEYSDEPGADKRGGDLGRFRKGAMVPQFTEGVEALKVGDTSTAPVETPFGYHVIWRTQ